jgi:hypothetical protein
MAEQHTHMPLMGLYYPYIHFRDDESWLKLAALYWPRMARAVAPDYPIDDSEIVKRLTGELNFVVNVPPASSTRAAEASFTQFINSLSADQRDRWGVRKGRVRWAGDDDGIPVQGIDPDERFSYIPRSKMMVSGFRVSAINLRLFGAVHLSEVTHSMRETLVDAELAFVTGNWLAMSPELVWQMPADPGDRTAKPAGPHDRPTWCLRSSFTR